MYQRSPSRSSSSARRKRVRISAGHRMQPLRQIAGILGRAQASLGLQAGEDRGAFRPLDRNQSGDRRSVLRYFDRLAPADASDDIAGVMAELSQPHR